MQSDQELLLHIGYHKTATTWLQTRLFNNREIGFAMLNGRKRLLKELVLRQPAQFNIDTARQKLDRRALIRPDDPVYPVVSLERFCGSPHTGGIDSTLIAERLHTLYPNARVLIVVREQNAILLSTYRQYVRAGGRASLQHYLKPPLSGSMHIPAFRMDYFEYHHLIRFYQTLFGRERVLLLPYEMFKRAPAEFVAAIIRFCGAERFDHERIERLSPRDRVHPSLSAVGTEIKRLLNFVADSPNRYAPAVPIRLKHAGRKRLIRALEAIDRRLPQSLKERQDQRQHAQIAVLTQHKFEHSNRLTSDLSGIELAQYGYAVSTSE